MNQLLTSCLFLFRVGFAGENAPRSIVKTDIRKNHKVYAFVYSIQAQKLWWFVNYVIITLHWFMSFSDWSTRKLWWSSKFFISSIVIKYVSFHIRIYSVVLGFILVLYVGITGRSCIWKWKQRTIVQQFHGFFPCLVFSVSQ